MRKREDVIKEWRGKPSLGVNQETVYKPSGRHIDGLLLEILLDIRDLLMKKGE